MLEILIILFILYAYYMFLPIDTDAEWLEDAIDRMKTGDIILFKGTSYHTLIFGYFTHIGVVVRRGKDVYIFEANSPRQLELFNDDRKNGIHCTPLKERIEKYVGKCWWKPLNKKVANPDDIEDLISYAIDNFNYELRVITNCVKKTLGIERIHHKINCAELTVLSLIKLDVLDANVYEQRAWNHLKYIAKLTHLDNGYKFMPLIRLKIYPFKV